MLRFVLLRLAWFVPNTLLLTFLLFAVLTSWLGSPASMMLGTDATTDAIRQMNAVNGWDDPVLVQYFRWLWNALHGEFGRSFFTREHVTSMIIAALPVSVELAIWSILAATVLAVGLNSLIVGRNPLSGVISTLSVVGITVPNFVLGASLIFFFSIYLRWLPTSEWVPWTRGVLDHLRHLILPVATLSAFYFGSFSMIYRSEYRAVASQLYVRVAKAKGISDQQVSFVHVMPNAVMPIITYIGMSLGNLMGGAVVTEVVFSLPGLGRLFVGGIRTNDYPVILAVGVIVLAAMMVANLLADILFARVNPQVRLAR